MLRRAGLIVLALTLTGCSQDPPEASEPSGTSTAGASTPARPSPTWELPRTGGTIPTGAPSLPTVPQSPGGTTTPGRHNNGTCPAGGPSTGSRTKFIVGTQGDDQLVGTGADETICGLGGDDVIVGGGGRDTIFGGQGDDTIRGGPQTDFLYGGDGDDILMGLGAPAGGYDYLWGDSREPQYDDSGNDVLLGTGPSTGEAMYGGPGNDQLVPTNQPALTNYADGGAGSDIIVTQNYQGGFKVDIVDPDGKPDPASVQLTSACKLTFEEGGNGHLNAAGSCDLPWPKRLSGLDKVVPLSASIDSTGRVTAEAAITNQLGKLSASGWRDMISWQASLADQSDVCVCDPLSSTPPKDLRRPWDLGR